MLPRYCVRLFEDMEISAMQTQIQILTSQAKLVMEKYRETYSDVQMGRDYFPLKISEEWGECLQAFLMYSDRGRQKGKTKEEIHELLSQEFADVFAYLLLFAESEGVDLAKAIDQKWFLFLKG